MHMSSFLGIATLFRKGCPTNTPSNSMEVLAVPLANHQHGWNSRLTSDKPEGVKWHLNVISLYISLITNKGEQLFLC